MERLMEAFLERGYPVPMDLISMIERATDRRTLYHRLYGIMKFGAGVGGGLNTFCFPYELRQAIRARFPDDESGLYDGQYESTPHAYYVTYEDLASVTYPKQK